MQPECFQTGSMYLRHLPVQFRNVLMHPKALAAAHKVCAVCRRPDLHRHCIKKLLTQFKALHSELQALLTLKTKGS
jgi:chromosome condensin MukBEF ATPase and DNA-binding subunit MukB